MQQPWRIPAYEAPGHVLPLGAGRWRGPSADGRTARLLAAKGVHPAEELADGSMAWTVERPGGVIAPPRIDSRADWILTRLAAGMAAYAAPPPAPRMLGILNLTSDSFSDGGALLDGSGALQADALLDAAARLRAEGAAVLDLGAESTRPGAEPVAEDAQLARLLPALDALRAQPLPLSVDTRSAAVAEACLDAGATWVNDVSGLGDPRMAPLLARRGAPSFLMHMRGTPADMREHTEYRHLLGEVADELAARVAQALAAGVRASSLVLDPGIGFAKDAAQSTALVAGCGALRALGFPLLLGPSRKSYLKAAGAPDSPVARDAATVEAAATCGRQGAAWLRLHRGGAALEAARGAHARAFGAAEATGAADAPHSGRQEPTR